MAQHHLRGDNQQGRNASQGRSTQRGHRYRLRPPLDASYAHPCGPDNDSLAVLMLKQEWQAVLHFLCTHIHPGRHPTTTGCIVLYELGVSPYWLFYCYSPNPMQAGSKPPRAKIAPYLGTHRASVRISRCAKDQGERDSCAPCRRCALNRDCTQL